MTARITTSIDRITHSTTRPGSIRRGRHQGFPVQGLLLLLLTLPAWALAQSTGLVVEPGDRTLLTRSPREVATTVIRVTNRTGAGALFESRLLLPSGWRAITPSFPFRVADGETAVRLLSFLIPEHTPAGDYRVRFQVEQRSRPAVSGGVRLAVRVRPVYQLRVEALEVPSLVIAGETFTASYRISNHSNAALEVGFGAESRRGYRIRPAGGALSLAPGAAETVELRVETEDAGRGLRDTLSLTAEALDGALSDGAEQSIEVVPRVSAGEETHYTIPTWFTTAFGGEVRDGEQTTGMQLSWAGAGPLDDTGERYLSFMIRGPDMTDETILGRREEIWLAYRGRDLDLTLGDRSYWLSPLTEQGRYGRGGGLRWRQGRWQINAFHLREEFTERDLEDALWEDDVEDAWELEAGLQHDDLWWGDETGLGVGLALTPDWMLGLNLLHKHDNEGRNTVSTLQTAGQLPGDVLLDLELGVSDGDLGHGRGLFAALAHSGEALRYRVKFYHADPEFKGYYRNQRYFGAEFDYQAEGSPWDLRGYYRRQRLNLDLEPELSAPLDEDMLFGVGYVWPGGDRLGVDLRHRRIRDLQPEMDADAVKDSLRLDFSKRLPALDLSLAGQVQLYAPAADLLPSQTFRGRRGAFGGQREIGRDDLRLRGGLAQVLVTITDGEETMRRVTNPNGDFRFVGLKPGTWTVSLQSDGLPENASAVEDSFTFELEPGEEAEARFRVEQRIRRMRMLSPLKVSAVADAAQMRAA